MLTTSDIIRVIQHITGDDEHFFYTQSDHWHYGWRQTPDRVVAVARMAVEAYPGDLVEIGCARGNVTERLAEIAQEHGRLVIAVDPWQRDKAEYEEFAGRLYPYRASVHVLHMKSQEQAAIDHLKRPLCFAFVDGEHVYHACLSDLKAVAHAGVIAVDDVLWDWQLLRAFHEVGEEMGKAWVRHPWCNEGYMV